MREKFIVRSITPNNGIRQIHMVHDTYRDELSQPIDILINTKSDIFRVNDEWFVSMTLAKRGKEESK